MAINHLQTFLEQNRKRVAGARPQPIIQRWVGLPRMHSRLAIMNTKVGALLTRRGGRSKLRDWFLSGDRNYNTITAERFLVDYITRQNANVEDTLTGPGPDAVLHTADGDVQLEATTLNSDVGQWILTERLTEQLEDAGFLTDKRLKIVYSFERVYIESAGDLYGYVSKIAQAIQSNDAKAANDLGIAFTVSDGTGTIVWDQNLPSSPADPAHPKIPWLKILTADVLDRVTSRSKYRQLTAGTRALLFVGVNNAMLVIWPFPEIFSLIAGERDESDHMASLLQTFWQNALTRRPYLAGVCYFVYSLKQEAPYYPLRIFWRRDDDRIAIRV